MDKLSLLIAASVSTYAIIAPDKCFVSRPTPEFMGDRSTTVVTHTDDMDRVCKAKGTQRSEKVRLVACTVTDSFGSAVVHVPNPCTYSEPYAQILCHELAHANGWHHPVE